MAKRPVAAEQRMAVEGLTVAEGLAAAEGVIDRGHGSKALIEIADLGFVIFRVVCKI